MASVFDVVGAHRHDPGRLLLLGDDGVYYVVYSYLEERIGFLAAHLALRLVDSLLPANLRGVERLDRIWRSGWRRFGMRVLTGVRAVSPRAWTPYPHPRDLASKVEVPWLIVHGRDDHFFPLRDAETLYECSAGVTTLWVERRFGHAEEGLTPAFTIALGSAIREALTSGRFPERERVRP